MRVDPAGSSLTLSIREPRIVVGIIYPTGSIYVTNKAAGAISNVPGNIVAGCLEDVSSTSQEIIPEEGRSTIGTLTFSVVDVAGALTTELRAQLVSNDLGVGRRLVRVYTGDTNDFTDGTWRQIDLYVVDSAVSVDRNSYKFSCSDLKRELRDRIFVKRSTRLVNDITDSATSIEVSSTTDFSLVAHTAAFSDAPSATVGYGRIKKTGEVFRFTGKATGPIRFTGVTRGVFNTTAQAVDVDPAASVDRQPEIEQVYYLEMPAPQMAYALMTGNVPDTAIVLPDDYTLGIDTALVDITMFQQIGTDLYNPSDLTAGLVLSFSTTRGLVETDGKQFIEEQLNVPMWAFNPISADGKIGLRRLTQILSDALPVAFATTSNIVDHGSLDHGVGDVINRVVVKWNHNGDDFTRTDELINAGSISRHGLGATRTFEFLGLTVQRHTVQTLNRIFSAITDRYGAPPQTLELTLSSTLNAIETGDVLSVTLPLRDYAGASTLSRSFEVEQRQWNPRTGEIRVRGFASTSTDQDQPAGSVVPLTDAWYTSAGTALSASLTIVANAVTVNGNLAAGTYYHAGNLTINAGVTVTINGTVQLRIRGTLTINGKIDGKGRGQTGLTDSNTLATTYVPFNSPTVQTIGTTRGSSGLAYVSGSGLYAESYTPSIVGRPAVARASLEVISGALLGLPTECRGTPGIYGGPVVEQGSTPTTRALGSAGGNSGAGLIIVGRGTPVFGASGTIDLSGNDGGTPPGSVTLGGHLLYAGGGGGGAPGELYVFLDGNTQVLPDINTTTFVANFGATTQTGNPVHFAGGVNGNDPNPTPADPWTGFTPGIGSLDVWQSASFTTWVPTEIQLGTSDDEIVPAPTGLAASGLDLGVTLTWVSPPADTFDYIEVWRATTNDRTGAVLVFKGRADSYFETSQSIITRYFWVRARSDTKGVSAWQPTGSTSGVPATYGGAIGVSPWTPVLTNVTRYGNTYTKTGGAANTWDSEVRSLQGYVGCAVSWRFGQTDKDVMVALNSDPTTNTSYLTLDYALQGTSNGHLQLYESGSGITDYGAASYSTSDVFTITYDGVWLKYYKNATLLLTRALVGALLYLDSAFYASGAYVTDLTFGQITRNEALSRAWVADSDGRPAGIRKAYDSVTATPTTRGELSLVAGNLQIAATTSTGYEYAFPAIPINPAKTYQITIKRSGTVASASGFYLYSEEYNAAMPAGKTHLGDNGAHYESMFVSRTTVVSIAGNLAIPTTPVTETYTYTPTAGSKFMSLTLWNYFPGTNTSLIVEWAAMTELGSNVDMLPGVLPPIDTFNMNADIATDVYTQTTFGSYIASVGSPQDDTISVTVAEDSIIQVVCRANSQTGAGGSWQCLCGATLDGVIVSGSQTFQAINASFPVVAGTYAVGSRFSSSAGSPSISDRRTEVTAVKR